MTVVFTILLVTCIAMLGFTSHQAIRGWRQAIRGWRQATLGWRDSLMATQELIEFIMAEAKWCQVCENIGYVVANADRATSAPELAQCPCGRRAAGSLRSYSTSDYQAILDASAGVKS